MADVVPKCEVKGDFLDSFGNHENNSHISDREGEGAVAIV